MTFFAGQKVVCVNDSWHPYPDNYTGQFSLPSKGAIYVVSSVDRYPNGDYLTLVEFGSCCDFYALKFRPVIERKTDISCFTRLLTPTDKVSV